MKLGSLILILGPSLVWLVASAPENRPPPRPPAYYSYDVEPHHKFKYAAPSCRKPLIRKEWRFLSNKEKTSYIKAVQCMGSKYGPGSISGIPGLRSRYDDFQGIHTQQTPNIHWVGHFILWHRYFIATYEKMLRRDCGYIGAQPYWNWTIDNSSGRDMSCWPIFDERNGFGGNGAYVDGPNPLAIPGRSGGGCVPNGPFTWPRWSVNLGPGPNLTYSPKCLGRDFSRPLMSWATAELQGWVTNVTNYEDLAYRLENLPVFTEPNLHGAGHFGIGGALGTMGDVYASPGDPIFWLHHTTLDKLLWRWQQKDLPARFFDVGGPVIPFDYSNLYGPNITLNFRIGLGRLAPNITLKSIMNVQGGLLCYDYLG